MKKSFLLFVFSIIINCHNTVTGQNLSIEEAQKILVGEKWLLIKLEQDNKVLKVPSELEGKRMVFKPNGYVYHFMPSEVQAEKANTGFRWSITKTQLSIADNLVYSYSLKDIDGMKLYLTRPGEPTFVYVRDRNFGTEEYDDFYVSSPEADSSMKELFARMNQAIGFDKVIIGSWNLEKISFQSTITKPDPSREEYIAVFKMALSDSLKREGYIFTKDDNENIDLIAGIQSAFHFGSALYFKESNKISRKNDIGLKLGKYTITSGNLNINWGFRDEVFEIVKIYPKELVLINKELKVTFYYKRSE